MSKQIYDDLNRIIDREMNRDTKKETNIDISEEIYKKININNEIDINKEIIINKKRMSCSVIHNKGERINYKWISDSAVTHCYNENCKVEFTWYYRKHHCRVCGRIFCDTCSSKRIEVPESLQVKREYKEDTGEDIVNFSPNDNYLLPGYMKSLNNSRRLSKSNKNMVQIEKVRVCDSCEKKIVKLKTLKNLIKYFELVNFDIKQLKKMSILNKTYYQVAHFYLHKISQFQYFLSDHKFTKFEKEGLWKNREYLMGHNKWIVQLLKSIDYNDYTTNLTKLNEIFKLINNNKKIVDCETMMCPEGHCHIELTAEDCLTLLDNTIHSKKIKNFALKYLDKANITELTCYLPYYAHYIKYESIENSILGEYFLNKCVEYSQLDEKGNIDSNRVIFINEFYWNLVLGLEDKKYAYIYKYFLDKFHNEIERQLLKLITDGHHLLNFLDMIPKDLDDKRLRDYVKSNISKMDNLIIPLNPLINNFKINIDEIKRKVSATKPIYIPIRYQNYVTNLYDNYNLLYKNEDIRKDKIILNIIKLIDLILKKEEDLDLNIITYGVRPMNSESGLIQIVPDCETIYHIKNNMNCTILNFIMNNNPDETIQTIRYRFMKSCAAYCVITYLLGIGDRHLDNIMITKSGLLFHIDYGFIMGFNAKPITPQMRITDDMVDALGGIKSETYQEFKTLCQIIYTCLRRHVNLFINMLSLLSEIEPPIPIFDNKTFKREHIKNEILTRFVPGEDNEQAELQLVNYIESSSNNYKHLISDFFHHHNKDNIVTSTINTGYDGAKHVISNVFNYMTYMTGSSESGLK